MESAVVDRDELIRAHLPLCSHILASVAAHFPRHADRDELAQAARLGLVEAAHRFEPERGVPFERWAALRIRGAILDAVRAVDFAPRALRHAMREVEGTREQLEHELGRTPTLVERADRLGMSPDRLNSLEGRAHRSLVISLDAGDDRDDAVAPSLAATLVDHRHRDPLTVLEDAEQRSYLRDALALLPERLRDVVVGYFLEGQSSAQIAARLHVTESRISQLRSEALGLLRIALAAQYGDATPATPRQASFAHSVAGRTGFRDRIALSATSTYPDDVAQQPMKSASETIVAARTASSASR